MRQTYGVAPCLGKWHRCHRFDWLAVLCRFEDSHALAHCGQVFCILADRARFSRRSSRSSVRNPRNSASKASSRVSKRVSTLVSATGYSPPSAAPGPKWRSRARPFGSSRWLRPRTPEVRGHQREAGGDDRSPERRRPWLAPVPRPIRFQGPRIHRSAARRLPTPRPSTLDRAPHTRNDRPISTGNRPNPPRKGHARSGSCRYWKRLIPSRV